MIQIKDRTDGNVGLIHSHGTTHLTTSSPIAHGDGDREYQTTDQDSVIGQNGKAPIAEGPDVVDTAGRQAAEYREPEHAANPQVMHGDGALKSVTASEPVVARLSKGLPVTSRAAIHGVSSHPHLMRAHQMGSISASDHDAVHGADQNEFLAKPGSNLPKGGSGMSEATGEPESVVAVAPASDSALMPTPHVDTTTKVEHGSMEKAQKFVRPTPVRCTTDDILRGIADDQRAAMLAKPISRNVDRSGEVISGEAAFVAGTQQEQMDQILWEQEQERLNRAAKVAAAKAADQPTGQPPVIYFAPGTRASVFAR